MAGAGHAACVTFDAMILAAGRGERLAPLTTMAAKPTLWVGDAPLLAHVASRLEALAPSARLINAWHAAGTVQATAAMYCPGWKVAVEPSLLGTAGGVANVRSQLGADRVLVHTGDVDAKLPLEVAARTSSEALILVRPVSVGAGTVGWDDGGRVVRLRSARAPRGQECMGGLGLGVFVLGRSLYGLLPEVGCLVSDVLAPIVGRGGKVDVLACDAARWTDIGTPPDFLAANMAWLSARGLDRWVAPGATAAGDLRQVIVAPGASAVGPLRGVVVLPGARAQGPLENAVVTVDGPVQL